MKTVEAIIQVSSQGAVILKTDSILKQGRHRILMAVEEDMIVQKRSRPVKRVDLFSRIKSVDLSSWPEGSSFRRMEIYDDNGR